MPSPTTDGVLMEYRPRIVVADADDDRRASRVAALREAGFVVCAQADEGPKAAELARYYGPDLLLACADLPGHGGLETTRRVVDASPATGVVLLVTDAHRSRLLADAFRAGARGVADVEAQPAEVHAALLAVYHGHGAVPPALLLDLAPVAGRGLRPIHSPLSNREWEIVDRLIAGDSPADVAHALFLTEATVRSHLKHMYAKLDVHSRDELIDAARRLFAQTSEVNPPPP